MLSAPKAEPRVPGYAQTLGPRIRLLRTQQHQGGAWTRSLSRKSPGDTSSEDSQSQARGLLSPLL